MGTHFLLRYTCDRLTEVESSTAVTDNRLWSREHRNMWHTMARNICQSVEYFLQDKMGVMGPLAILTQLRECKSCLENDSFPEKSSREICWTTDLIERIQKRVDFPVNNLFRD